MRERFVTPQEFLSRRLAVSDIQRFTSASNPVSCLDLEKRMVYSPYHASRTGYGEQASVFALAEIPVDAPGSAQNYILLESDVEFQGRKYNWPVDSFAILHNGLVRIFFLADATCYYYLDWSPEEHRIIGAIRPVMCIAGKKSVPLTASVVEEYLKEHGCTGYRLGRDPRENIIATAKPAWGGAHFYGMLTSGMSQPILFRCKDAETFEFLSIIPTVCQYECQVALHRGKIYAIVRGVPGDNFYVADVGNWRFRPCGRLPMAETRAQLMTWRDRILIGYSQNGIQPNRIRDGRNNLIILIGEGEDLGNYREVFRAVDELGIVSFDIIDCDGDLFAIWSNSERFPDKPRWNGLHGKDALFASWLTRQQPNMR